MKGKIWYLLLATIPLVLSPVCQIIYRRLQVITHEGELGMGGLGIGIIISFNCAVICIVGCLGIILYSWLQNRTVILNPLKIIIQWDGFAKNIIRVLGYAQIYLSVYIIKGSIPNPYKLWYHPYGVLCGVFGVIGAILYVLVFCSAENV